MRPVSDASEAKRQTIRDMQALNPRMTQREIADACEVTACYVSKVLKAAPQVRAKSHALPPPCTVQQPGSIIRPMPWARLMARR